MELLRIPKLFQKKITSRLEVVIRDVPEHIPELQVDFNLDFSELDSKKKDIALEETKNVGNDFKTLEKCREKKKTNL